MFERFWRLAHVFWRFSRGQTLDVRVLATDRSGAVMLVQSSQAGLWRLPGTLVGPGETAGTAARRALAAAGGKPDKIILYQLYRGPGWPKADQVALYRADNIATQNVARESPARFFPPKALPHPIEAASGRRIAEVVDGTPPPEDW